MASYFDKFIEDQLKRSQKIREERQNRQVKPEDDLKRNMVNHYRERIRNLMRYRGKK